MMGVRWVVIILGVVLALIAIRLDDHRVAWVALGVLCVALALRFAMPRRRPPEDGPPGTSGDDSSAST